LPPYAAHLASLLLSSIMEAEMVACRERNCPAHAPPPILAPSALLPSYPLRKAKSPLAAASSRANNAYGGAAPWPAYSGTTYPDAIAALRPSRRCGGIGCSRTSATRETRDINPS
jgi:hypothetical protein